jgi:hypothetical protein
MHEWNLIATMPRTGKYFLVWDENLTAYEVANHPEGYAIGRWFKNNKNKCWNGVALPGYFKATHWGNLPKGPKHI